MRKLLRSNFIRLSNTLSFGLALAFVLLWNGIMLFSSYDVMIAYGDKLPIDSLLFTFLFIVGIALSVLISLFIGTDYSDGTIRNKIITGQSRQNIYIANFITCAAIGLLLCIWGAAVNLAIGIPLFGMPEISVDILGLLFWDSILAAIAYAAIFNLVGMLCSNKSHAVMICILTAFALFFVTIYLYSALAQPEISEAVAMTDGEMSIEMMSNPNYISGMKREIYQFFLDFLPSGQCAQIANLEVLHPIRMGIYSAIIIILSNLLGIFVFRKKDIK